MGRSVKPVHIVMAVILVLFAVSLFLVIFRHSSEGNSRRAVITQDGKLLYEIELDKVTETYQIRIDGKDGCYNIIEVRPGSIGVCEASCPDKVCVNMGFISDGLLPVTCLPNRVIIRIENDKISDSDIAVY